MDVDDITAQVGLWWPSADEDGLREAARAWYRAAGALDEALDVGRAGAARATAGWTGDAATAFARSWRDHETALVDDATGARALAAALDRYADAVTDAKRRVEQLAITAGATIVAGVGLAWLTFGTSAAAAAGVSAGLVAAASAIGVELSATAAAIVGGALVGLAFGAVEGAVVDLAVTQPLRVEAFGDGGYAASEVSTAATAGGLFGGVLGGVAPLARSAPRTAADDLGELDGRISAALDPGLRGALGPLFRAGVHETPTAAFTPGQLPAARLLESEGLSVHARTDTGALVRSSPGDRGRFTELVRPEEASGAAVENAFLEANGRLQRHGTGAVVIDARGTGLDAGTAGQGLVAAVQRAMAQGDELPDSVRLVFDDRSIHFP